MLVSEVVWAALSAHSALPACDVLQPEGVAWHSIRSSEELMEALVETWKQSRKSHVKVKITAIEGVFNPGEKLDENYTGCCSIGSSSDFL